MTPPPELVKPGLPPPVGEQEFVGKVVWEEADIKRVVSRSCGIMRRPPLKCVGSGRLVGLQGPAGDHSRHQRQRASKIPIRKIETLQIGQNVAQACRLRKSARGRLAGQCPAGMPGMEGGMPGMEAGMGAWLLRWAARPPVATKSPNA